MSIKDDTAYPRVPEQPVHHVRLLEDKRKNGLGVAALVVGIVAAVFSIIPLVGMIAFLLGPIALILGLIALFLKNRKKGMAVTGVILGVVSVVVAGMMTAGISAAAKSVDEKINAEHTVEYLVTTSGPAHISYWTPGGTSTEDITAEWKKSITSKEFNITSISVTGSYSDAKGAVTCEILIDGKSAGKNTGNGTGAHASCSGNTWQK